MSDVTLTKEFSNKLLRQDSLVAKDDTLSTKRKEATYGKFESMIGCKFRVAPGESATSMKVLILHLFLKI